MIYSLRTWYMYILILLDGVFVNEASIEDVISEKCLVLIEVWVGPEAAQSCEVAPSCSQLGSLSLQPENIIPLLLLSEQCTHTHTHSHTHTQQLGIPRTLAHCRVVPLSEVAKVKWIHWGAGVLSTVERLSLSQKLLMYMYNGPTGGIGLVQ